MIELGTPFEDMSPPAKARLKKYGSTLSKDNVDHVTQRIADYPEIIDAVHKLDIERARREN